MLSWMLLRAAVLCVAMGCALAGCAPASPLAQYQTIGEDPRRDTDAARVENAKALEAMEQGDDAKAEAHLKTALTADIMFGPAHNNLGKIYYQQNKLYLAAWEFEYAAKLMPHQPEPRNNLGMVFEAAGKLDEAIAQYTEALKLEPENPELIGNAARARVRRGDNDEEVRRLLSKLVLRDTRPEWVEWATRWLALAPLRVPSTHPSR